MSALDAPEATHAAREPVLSAGYLSVPVSSLRAHVPWRMLACRCDWTHGARLLPPTECLDFSDTHELAYILGLGPIPMERFLHSFLLGDGLDASRT